MDFIIICVSAMNMEMSLEIFGLPMKLVVLVVVVKCLNVLVRATI